MILKLQLASIALFAFGIFSAQVGVNTNTPLGTFHIDGAKDNLPPATPTASQISNDVIVTSAGNVGIGTISPSRKLEIVSSTTPAFKLVDGSQNANYVLMSDASGNASWKATTQVILGNFGSGINSAMGPGNFYIGASITLPPGKWLVLTNIVLKATPTPTGNQGAWVRIAWSPLQNSNDSTNVIGNLVSGVYVAPTASANGGTLITNATSSNKTFYLNVTNPDIFGGYTANWNGLGSSASIENSIVAYPAN